MYINIRLRPILSVSTCSSRLRGVGSRLMLHAWAPADGGMPTEHN